jgi:hypothetical protein
MTTMIATPTSTLTPARIVEVGMAFWPAKVLLSGIELGVFTALGPNLNASKTTPRELRPSRVS